MTASTLNLASIQALAGTTVASTGAGFVTWALPFHAVGIGPAVLFMALAGTAAGLIFQPPGGSRAKLFGLAFVYTVVAAASAVVAGQFFEALKAVAPATALLLAFSAQTAIPVFREALAERIKSTIGGGK